jgi:protocatechuate 3,4-dioxygenase beta subunit
MHRRITGVTAFIVLAAAALGAAPQVLDASGRVVERAEVVSSSDGAWVRTGPGVPVRVEGGGDAVVRVPELTTARLLVLDAATGDPVTAGRLRWLGTGAPKQLSRVRWTAHGGRLDLPCLGGETLRVAAPGYRPALVAVEPGARRHTVLLEPRGDLEIAIRPATAGTLWLATSTDLSPFAPFRSVADEHPIASDGTVRVRDLDAAKEHRGVVLVPGRAPVVGTVDALPVRLELTLEHGLTVAGIVVDRHGRPVAAARIAATGRVAELDDFRYRQEALSDGDGRFAVGGLLPGEVAVAVCARGYACAERTLALDSKAPVPPERFELAPGHDLRVVIRDELDRPAAGAEVVDTETFRRLVADDDGAVVFPGVAPGDTVELRIFADGLRPWQGPVDTGAREVVIRIPLGGGLEWPILVNRPVDPGDVTAMWIRVDDRGRELREGDARWDPELEAVLASGLDVGRHRLEVRLPGAATLVSEIVDLGASEHTRLPAAVPERGLAVGGRVLDARTVQPVAGARVTCEPGSPHQFRKPDRLRRLPEALSDADGVFLLEGLDPGACRAVVRAPGFAPWRRDGVEPDEVGADLGDIELDRGMTVVGRVLDRAGRAQTGVAVEIAEDAPYAYFPEASATTDHDGWFRAEQLAAGRWQVTASRGEAKARAVVEGGPDEVETVELRLGGTRLEGEVWIGDRPAAGGHLVLGTAGAVGDGIVVMVQTDADRRRLYGVDEPPRTIAVAGDGRFAADGVLPGVYTASYTPAETGASPVGRELVVPQIELHRCLIRFSDAGIDGVVVDPDGRPVAGAMVLVVDRVNRRLADGFSDGDGGFRFTGLEVGEVRVGAAHGEFADARPVTLELRSGERAGPITLELGPPEGAELQLTVTSAGGSPAGSPVYLVGSATLTSFTDGRGVAVFTGVEAGRYRPCAAAFGGAVGCGPEVDLDDGDRRDLTLELGRGGRVDVLLGPVERTPALRVATADGIDLTSLLMMVSPPLPGPDGVRVGPLKADDYRIVVSRAGVTREGTIAAVEEDTVTLDLR